MNKTIVAQSTYDSGLVNARLLGVSILLAIGLSVAPQSHAVVTTATIYETPATAPSGGLWLNGSLGGHLWVADHISGLCRVDAGVINTGTCYNFGLGGSAGQPAYDPVTNFVYVPDLSSKSQGVTRMQYDPATETMFPDSIVAPTAGIAGDRPGAVALGPDGNLYVSFKKNGNIVRLTNPGCIDSLTVNCAALQVKQSVGGSSDGKRVNSIAFAGNDLYLAETVLLTRMRNVALCTGGCKAFQTGASVTQPLSVAYDGKYLWVGNTTSVWRAPLIPGGNPGLAVEYANGFAFVSGIAVKVPTLASPVGAVFAADDPSAGLTPNVGRWWTMPYLP